MIVVCVGSSYLFYIFSYAIRERREIHKAAVLGGPAPNPSVHAYPSTELIGLLEAVPRGRRHLPTVLNFGSCT